VTKNYDEYGKLQKKFLLNDMKRVFEFIFNPFLFSIKTRINNEIVIQVISDTNFLKILKNIAFGCDNESIVRLKKI
jgi:hypothetical protein